MLILGFLAPVLTAALIHLLYIRYNYKIVMVLLLIFFASVTIYFSISTTGPEGPFYRLYNSIVFFVLFFWELSLYIQQNVKKIVEIIYLAILLVITCLFFFSEGVCNPF